MKIYKYRPIDQHIEKNIIHSLFAYVRVSNFNDPFELRPSFAFSYDQWNKENAFNTKEKVDKILKGIRNMNSFGNDSTSVLLNGIFVSCFTSTVDSILMWSYYANGHKGVCYEFDIPDAEYCEMDFSEVNYAEERPEIKIHITTQNSEDEVNVDQESSYIKKNIHRIITTKSNVWKHENEIRLFLKDKKLEHISKQYIDLSLPFISKIFLGALVTNNDKELIKQFALSKNIPVYQMEIDDRHYTLSPRPVI